MTDYDSICELLKESGFRRISVEGGKKSTFVNKDYSVSVTIEENQTKLTEEQIKMIKLRMKELGYDDDTDGYKTEDYDELYPDEKSK